MTKITVGVPWVLILFHATGQLCQMKADYFSPSPWRKVYGQWLWSAHSINRYKWHQKKSDMFNVYISIWIIPIKWKRKSFLLIIPLTVARFSIYSNRNYPKFIAKHDLPWMSVNLCVENVMRVSMNQNQLASQCSSERKIRNDFFYILRSNAQKS